MARIIKNNLGNFLVICLIFLIVFTSVLFLTDRQVAIGSPDTSEMTPTSADYCAGNDCSSPIDITSLVDTDNDGSTQDLNGKNNDSGRVDAWSYSPSVSGTINSVTAYCNFSSSDANFYVTYKWCDNSIASDCNDDASSNWSSAICQSANNPTDTTCDLKANGVDTASEVNNLWIKCIGNDADGKGPDRGFLDYMHVTVDFAPPAVSISITNTEVAFGIVALEEIVDNYEDIPVITVVTGPAKLEVKTTLFSDGTNYWTLGSSNGNNQVKWEFSPDYSDWTIFAAVDTPYLLAANVLQGNTQDLYLRLTMPTDTTSYEPYGATVTVVASAP